MKSEMYHMYILLAVEGEVFSIKKATCECVSGYVLYVSLNLKHNLIAIYIANCAIIYVYACLRFAPCFGTKSF